MDRISMSELTTYRWSFEQDIQEYATAGIPAVSVWRQKLSDFGDEKGADLLAECGVRVSSLVWAGGFTGSDGRSYKESVLDAISAIKLAANLRAKNLVVYTGARAGHTHNHARRLVKNALIELAPLAEEFGVHLAVEPMHGACSAGCTFLNDLDDALEIIAGVDSSHANLLLDTYHVGFDSSLLERLPALTPQICLVQLGDGREPPQEEQNRCRLGDGVLPLAAIIESLLENGYKGDFEIELLGQDIEPYSYHDLLTHSKKAAEDLITRAAAP